MLRTALLTCVCVSVGWIMYAIACWYMDRDIRLTVDQLMDEIEEERK